MTFLIRCFLFLITVVVCSSPVFSATRTWTGSGSDNNFSTAANWSDNIAPVYADDLIFPAVSAQFSLNNDLPMSPSAASSQNFHSLTFQGGSYSLNGAYNISDRVTVNGGNQNLGSAFILSGTLFVAENAAATARVNQKYSNFTIDGNGNSNITTFGTTGNSIVKQGTGTTSANWASASHLGQITVNNGRFIASGGISQSLTDFKVFGGVVEGDIGAVDSKILFTGPNSVLKATGHSFAINFEISDNAQFAPDACNASLQTYNLTLTNAAFNPSFSSCPSDINTLFLIYGTNPATGRFVNYPEGSFLNIGGKTYRFTYLGGDGNDIQIIRSKPISDFDGDGKSDVAVFRPSNGYWYTSTNPATNYGGIQFGVSTDKLVPADYDGDGKTDVAVYRNGTWYLQQSTAGFTGVTFGDSNDIPIPADYDGDGKADIAVFRPSNGTWYLQRSQLGFTGIAFGQNGDKPVAADYDGDGKADVAVNRGGTWYINRSTQGFFGIQFGDSNDKLVPADYDGDGKTDIAVFRPSNGVWYLQQSTSGFTGIAFGLGTDIPTAADYDGDGKADVAVFRNGTWYLQRSSQGFTGVAFGASTDKPIPNVFVQ